jgi:hypothetical protein
MDRPEGGKSPIDANHTSITVTGKLPQTLVGDILVMEQSYTQTTQSGANVLGLRLLFRLTRSQIQAIRVEGLPEGVQIAKKTFFQLGAEVTWDLALPDSTEVTATVEYEGEPLVLTDFVWITEGAQDNVLISIAKSVDPLKED